MDFDRKELILQGNALIQRGDYAHALDIGRRMSACGCIEGYELSAMAVHGMGNIEAALAILDAGIAIFPSAWRLWELRGNCKSDLGQYEESEIAYHKAMDDPHVDKCSVQYNCSVMFNRSGRYDKALQALDSVTRKAMELRVKSQRLAILNNMAQFDTVVSLGKTYLDEAGDSAPTWWLASVAAALAWAYWYGRRDGESAVLLARQAILKDRQLETSLWLIREIEGRVSPGNRLYRLLLEGRWPWKKEDGTLRGVFVSCDVVAESPEQAMEYVKACEERQIAESLKIAKCEKDDLCPNERSGVCRMGKYCLYDEGVP